jgi:hypothetical protein
VLAKPAADPSQLGRPFCDVSPADIPIMLHDQPLDFLLKLANLLFC